MKKLQPIALTLMLLLPLFLSTTTWGSLVASPITGHAGITLTLSDNLGSASASLNIGTIAFGTRQITVGTHNLAASKGTLSGDAIVTDANGEYQVTFNVPDLAANTYSIRVGGRTTPFNLTVPVLNPTAGQVGIRLTVSGQYGVPNTNLGAIQFDTTEITQTAHGLTVIKGTLDADLKSIITDGAGDYEAAFDVPDHIGGSVQVKVKDSQTTAMGKGFDVVFQRQQPEILLAHLFIGRFLICC